MANRCDGRRDIITNPVSVMIEECYEQFYANEVGNLDET